MIHVAGVLVALACGCSAGDDVGRSSDRVERSIQPIIGGVPSGADHDAVVVLGLFVDHYRRGLCSATLVAPNLVLTARHCVTDVDPDAECNRDGEPVLGAELHTNHPASEIAIFVPKDGKVVSNSDESLASAHGKELVIDETATTLCNRDFAFVVLDRDVDGPIARLRLGSAAMYERVTAVGWGVTETGLLPATRMERPGLRLLAAGPSLYPSDPKQGIGDAEVFVGESACVGDSGSPALTENGVVVGVASRAGNGQPRDANNLAATCTGDTARVVYDHFGTLAAQQLVWRAFDAAHQVPQLETPPLAASTAGIDRDPGSSTLGGQ